MMIGSRSVWADPEIAFEPETVEVDNVLWFDDTIGERGIHLSGSRERGRCPHRARNGADATMDGRLRSPELFATSRAACQCRQQSRTCSRGQPGGFVPTALALCLVVMFDRDGRPSVATIAVVAVRGVVITVGVVVVLLINVVIVVWP